MANVLTDLAADIYKAADIIGREAVGLIPSVTINSGSEAAAQGDTVRSHFTRAAVVNTSATPSMTIPEGDDQTVDSKTMTVSQIANVQIPWTGEDVKHVNNGSGFETIYGDQIAQAMRGITNSIESFLWGKLRANASRAVGAAGTTPFASNFNEVAEVRQVLFDNGMPVNSGQNSLVVNSLAGTNLRQLASLTGVDTSGNDTMLRQGTLLNLQGFNLKESAAPVSTAVGGGASYITDGTYAVGATAITVDGGTGTVLAGDVITFAGDTNKYVVTTGIAAAGIVTIGGPGLRETLADGVALSITAASTANIAVHQPSCELVMRPLENPMGGDAATDMMTVQDPHSGMVYQFSAYKGYKKAMLDVTVLYDAKVWKDDGVAILLG